MDDLRPDDVLVLVCSFLDVADHVHFGHSCRRFHAVSCKRGSWCDNLNLLPYAMTLNDVNLQRLVQARYRTIDADHCRSLTWKGIAALRDVEIQNLSLAGVGLEHDLSQGLKQLNGRALTHLDISQARFLSEDTLSHFGKRLKQLRNLNLSGIADITSAGVAHLTRLQGLRVLLLNECVHVNNAALKSISEIPSLRHLYLNRTAITNDGVAFLSKSPLSTLTVSGTAVGDAALEHLRKIPLAHVDLSDTYFSAPGLYKFVKDHSGRLSQLEIGGDAVTDNLLNKITRLASVPVATDRHEAVT